MVGSIGILGLGGIHQFSAATISGRHHHQNHDTKNWFSKNSIERFSIKTRRRHNKQSPKILRCGNKQALGNWTKLFLNQKLGWEIKEIILEDMRNAPLKNGMDKKNILSFYQVYPAKNRCNIFCMPRWKTWIFKTSVAENLEESGDCVCLVKWETIRRGNYTSVHCSRTTLPSFYICPFRSAITFQPSDYKSQRVSVCAFTSSRLSRNIAQNVRLEFKNMHKYSTNNSCSTMHNPWPMVH